MINLLYCFIRKTKPRKILTLRGFHAGNGNRTRTGVTTRRILSPVRLPVPPHRHLTCVIHYTIRKKKCKHILSDRKQSFELFLIYSFLLKKECCTSVKYIPVLNKYFLTESSCMAKISSDKYFVIIRIAYHTDPV